MTADTSSSKVASVILTCVAVCLSALARAWQSPVAMVTLVGCALVFAPFAVFALSVLFAGVLCCLPLVATGLMVAWVPAAARIVLAWTRTSPAVREVRQAAQDKPLVAIGAAVGVLALLPLLLFVIGAMVACFFFFAPVTFPLSGYGVWCAREYILPRSPRPAAATDATKSRSTQKATPASTTLHTERARDEPIERLEPAAGDFKQEGRKLLVEIEAMQGLDVGPGSPPQYAPRVQPPAAVVDLEHRPAEE